MASSYETDLEQALVPAEVGETRETRPGVFSRIVRGLTARDPRGEPSSQLSEAPTPREVLSQQTAPAPAATELGAPPPAQPPPGAVAGPAAPEQPEGFGGPTDEAAPAEEPGRSGFRGILSRFRKD